MSRTNKTTMPRRSSSRRKYMTRRSPRSPKSRRRTSPKSRRRAGNHTISPPLPPPQMPRSKTKSRRRSRKRSASRFRGSRSRTARSRRSPGRYRSTLTDEGLGSLTNIQEHQFWFTYIDETHQELMRINSNYYPIVSGSMLCPEYGVNSQWQMNRVGLILDVKDANFHLESVGSTDSATLNPISTRNNNGWLTEEYKNRPYFTETKKEMIRWDRDPMTQSAESYEQLVCSGSGLVAVNERYKSRDSLLVLEPDTFMDKESMLEQVKTPSQECVASFPRDAILAVCSITYAPRQGYSSHRVFANQLPDMQRECTQVATTLNKPALQATITFTADETFEAPWTWEVTRI